MNIAETYWAIVQVLNPDLKMGATQLSRETGASLPKVAISLKKLYNEGFINCDNTKWYLTAAGRDFYIVRSTL